MVGRALENTPGAFGVARGGRPFHSNPPHSHLKAQHDSLPQQGFHVLFTDTDIVWLADPRPWLVERAGLATTEKSTLDVLVQAHTGAGA